ncbi:alkaline proteinase [Plectosphaerella cucumerina]|uniref:Alkaline proteinase n=1 Tax=Plectosphaerella cucumerina TaxID=40658 RepID=A0A8K0TJS7_9PEZI|nr:alkaline proteinase [Plectosphaerella cucumerina]
MVNLKNLAALAGALLPFGLAAPLEAREQLPDVENKYIITLKPGISSPEVETHLSWVADVHKRNIARRDVDLAGVEKTYDIADFHGYAGTFDEATIEELKSNPDVASVEPDAIYTLDAFVTQTGVTHGLGSISSRAPGSSSYRYDDSAGAGTWVYVVDSGINIAHNEFGGRAVRGYNAVGGAFSDTLGHGTHVAGTVGGRTFGVAKATTLVDVKVFSGRTGSASVILDGYNWAVNDIITRGRQRRAVVNLSLGGPVSSAWATAVNAAFSQGILSVAASGNENQAATNRSPANVPNALTVGAIDSAWTQPSYSNYGPAVDILAPGSNVISAAHTSNTGSVANTGTSMAAPHVAGLAVYLAALENINTPAALTSRILALATTGRATTRQNTVNRVAYNGNA